MRITEIDKTLHAYQVTVAIPERGTVKTIIFATNSADAKALANSIYGRTAVRSLVEERPPNPEQQQAKALNNRAKALKAQAGQIKARAAMKNADDAAARARKPPPSADIAIVNT